jgi:hypothetical protein
VKVTTFVGLPSISLDENPLKWWCDNQHLYPLLSEFTKFSLGIPSTSFASERVLSTAGDVITAKRSCLTSANADMLIFLQKNLSRFLF